MPVPNQFPRTTRPYRIAFVGDCPCDDDLTVGQPFVGSAGRLLTSTIGKLSFAPHECFLGNISQTSQVECFNPHSDDLLQDKTRLFEDLKTFSPNIICCLGQSALDCFSSGDNNIGDYRGSLFLSTNTPIPWKCIATYHPASVQRNFSLYPFLKFDIQRAKSEALTPELVLPVRQYLTRPSLHQALTFINSCYGKLTAFDIEGWADHVGCTMLSLSWDPAVAIVIPFWIQGHHYWSESEETIIWAALSRYLADPDTPKVCQNGLYECFVMLWRHRCIIRGIRHDTMFAHWELHPEFDKNLGLQTSLYTREPYYKEDRESTDIEKKLDYSAKDSAVTREIIEVTSRSLQKQPLRLGHYLFNVRLIEPYTYIHLRGCALSQQAVTAERTRAEQALVAYSAELNTLIATSDFHTVFPKALKQYGGFNVKSIKHKQWLLYDYLAYKPYTRYGKTTAEEVLLRYRAKEKNETLTTLYRAIQCRTRISDLAKLTVNEDGRIRSSYNPVGTNTGRLNSQESNAVVAYLTKTGILKREGTGTNLQNVTEDARVCFTSDSDDDLLGQCDLSGADGWTVACDLAALGHRTMLDDYLAGIKPAKVLLLLLEEYERTGNAASINTLTREELKIRCDLINSKADDGSGRPRGWRYLCAKRVQHGTNYGAQPETVSSTIFKDSEGSIDLSKKEAGLYQWLYRLRYNPDARTKWIESELKKTQTLTAACGIERRFHDIRGSYQIDPAILRAACSFEPQANTTYATNVALTNLYYDPENRNSQGHLFVEPLLQIHDALVFQFKRKHLAFVRRKMPIWFLAPLTIHGITITIPYEGKYGLNWKDLDDDI